MVDNSRIKYFITKMLIPKEVINSLDKTDSIDFMVVCKINVEQCP